MQPSKSCAPSPHRSAASVEVLVPVFTRLVVSMRDRISATRNREPERGDVPGWVLITLMTAGIVAIIWGFAEDRLLEIVRDALDSVTPA